VSNNTDREKKRQWPDRKYDIERGKVLRKVEEVWGDVRVLFFTLKTETTNFKNFSSGRYPSGHLYPRFYLLYRGNL
jgi:hypothetical protein